MRLKKNKPETRRICDLGASRLYKANVMFSASDIEQRFKRSFQGREELSEDFIKQCSNKKIGNNYEISYVPVTFFETKTDKSWIEVETDFDLIYQGGEQIAEINYETATSMKETGIKGKSGYYCKLSNFCSAESISVKNLERIKASGNKEEIRLIKKGLTFTLEEENEIVNEIVREAAKVKSGQKASTEYSAVMTLVPILRYDFEYNGKKCVFFMNLHNGSCATIYGKSKEVNLSTKIIHTASVILTYHAWVFIPLMLFIHLIAHGQMFIEFGSVLVCLICLAGAIFLCVWQGKGGTYSIYELDKKIIEGCKSQGKIYLLKLCLKMFWLQVLIVLAISLISYLGFSAFFVI